MQRESDLFLILARV